MAQEQATPTTPAPTESQPATPATGTSGSPTTGTSGAPTNAAGDTTPTGTTATTATTGSNPATAAATTAATPQISEQQQQKYTSASNPNTMNGIPFNVHYGKLDVATVKENVKQFNNGKNYGISCYLIPKFVRQERLFEQGNNCPVFALTYNKQVKRIVLQDKLDAIGMSGFVEIDNKTSWMDVVLERHNNYYFVIVISEWATISKQTESGVTQSMEEIVKYQPYIFDIDSVMNLTAPNTEDKKIRVYLVDLMTSILNSHSIASVIRFNTEITKAQNYKRVFEIIMNYIKCHLKINMNDSAHFYKDLMYKDAMLCGGNQYNGYDDGNDMSQLVNNSFGKINRNATIREALYQLLKDCVTTLKTPKAFSDAFETIGDVLVPFFFKEEYPDRCFLYPSIWIDSEAAATQASTTNTATDTPATGTAATTDTAGTNNTPPTTTTGDNASPNPADSSSSSQPSTAAPATPTPSTPATRTRAVTRQGQNTGSTGNNQSNPNITGWVNSATTGTSGAGAPTTNPTPTATTGEASANAQATPNTETPAKTTNPHKNFYKEYGEGKVLMRQVTMRDMFMPFFLAFGNDKFYGVYDHIMPDETDKQEDLQLSVINQIYQKNVRAIQFDPIDMNKVRRIWKNMVFIDCSSEGTGGNSTLIFFDWIYQYFSQVFLNKNKRGYVSNVIPSFYVVARSNDIGTAEAEGNSFDALFDEYNAYTIATETEDTVNECLRMIGKNIASFVLLNDVYTYTIEGDIMRRPNEIVKMNFNLQNDTQTSLTVGTDLSGDSTLMMYMRKVIHDFSGNEYTNIVTGCKICEYVGDATNVTKTFANSGDSGEPTAATQSSSPATATSTPTPTPSTPAAT